MCCNISIYAYAGMHNAPVISCVDIDAPSLCNSNKLTTFRGKYEHPSVFRAETKALLLTHCSQILRHPTPPQILDTIIRMVCVEAPKAVHILFPSSSLGVSES